MHPSTVPVKVGHSNINGVRQVFAACVGPSVCVAAIIPFIPGIPPVVSRQFSTSAQMEVQSFSRVNTAHKFVIGRFQFSLPDNGRGLTVLADFKPVSSLAYRNKGGRRRVDLKIQSAGNLQ
jgi:hypothetical protein